MAWIDYPSPDDEPEWAELVQEVREQRGKLANIIAVQGGNPDAVRGHMDLYMAIMYGDRGLSRFQRELIATYVSALNDCEYCVDHHSHALDHYCYDEELFDAVKRGEISDELNDADRVLLEYCRELTLSPGQMSEDRVEKLREQGFGDGDILAANLITAYFNMVNRTALGLGVELEDEGGAGYDY